MTTHKADFIIVGAGYAGLMCALTLGQAGADVILVDAHPIGGTMPPLPGENQSAISGGHVMSTLSQNYDDVAAVYGIDYARALFQLGISGVGRIAELCRIHGIEDAAFRRGYVVLAANSRDEGELQKKIRRLQVYGGISTGPVIRDATTTKNRFVSPLAKAASLYSPVHGQIEPRAYVEGLARAAQACGVRVMAPEKIISFVVKGQEASALAASGAEYGAPRMIVSGGSQILRAGHFPEMRKYQAVVGNAAVKTEPLPLSLIDRIFPCGYEGAFADMRHADVMYGRLDSKNRIDFGTSSFAGRTPNFAVVEKSLYRIFPQLHEAGIGVSERRYGFLTGTRQEFVQFYQWQKDGRVRPVDSYDAESPLTVMSAFAGEGINLGTISGEAMARACLGQTDTFHLLARMHHAKLPITFPWEAANTIRDTVLAKGLSVLDGLGSYNGPIGIMARFAASFV